MRSRAMFCIALVPLLAACEGSVSRGDGSIAPDRRGGEQVVQDQGPASERPVFEAGTPDVAPPDAPGGPVYDGKPGEFVKTASGRTYRLLVPAGYQSQQAIPLLVGFHGAGDTGANFYAICKSVGWAAAAAPASFVLLVPDTKSPYQDFAIWTGNPLNDIPQMKQEMSEIVAIIGDIGTHYHLDLKQIHAFGFSDGGLFTAIAGLDRASYFASLAVMGYGWGSSYPGVSPPRKIAVQFVVGSSDSFASYVSASEAYLAAQGHATRKLVAASVGHSFSGLMQSFPPTSIFGWMQQHPLP